MMNFFLIPLLILNSLFAASQTVRQALQKDTIKTVRFGQAAINKPVSALEDIKSGLQNILNKYRKASNDNATWAKIKLEAEDFLYTYFKAGKLLGTTTAQAFYVQIGLQTITAADIADGRKILLAGIADLKPAEFTVIRIESK